MPRPQNPLKPNELPGQSGCFPAFFQSPKHHPIISIVTPTPRRPPPISRIPQSPTSLPPPRTPSPQLPPMGRWLRSPVPFVRGTDMEQRYALHHAICKAMHEKLRRGEIREEIRPLMTDAEIADAYRRADDNVRQLLRQQTCHQRA